MGGLVGGWVERAGWKSSGPCRQVCLAARTQSVAAFSGAAVHLNRQRKPYLHHRSPRVRKQATECRARWCILRRGKHSAASDRVNSHSGRQRCCHTWCSSSKSEAEEATVPGAAAESAAAVPAAGACSRCGKKAQAPATHQPCCRSCAMMASILQGERQGGTSALGEPAFQGAGCCVPQASSKAVPKAAARGAASRQCSAPQQPCGAAQQPSSAPRQPSGAAGQPAVPGVSRAALLPRLDAVGVVHPRDLRTAE